MEGKMNALEGRMNGRKNALEGKFDSMETTMEEGRNERCAPITTIDHAHSWKKDEEPG